MISFGAMSAIDRLSGRLGLGSAAKKREAAFEEISRLVRGSEVPKGEALLKTIKPDTTLSVTFAVPDKKDQQKLNEAYAKLMIQRMEDSELDIDGGLDDENLIASLGGLWKEV